jgi:hypothetical protein
MGACVAVFRQLARKWQTNPTYLDWKWKIPDAIRAALHLQATCEYSPAPNAEINQVMPKINRFSDCEQIFGSILAKK